MVTRRSLYRLIRGILDFVPVFRKCRRECEAHSEEVQQGSIGNEGIRRPFYLRDFRWRNPEKDIPAIIQSRRPAESADFEIQGINLLTEQS